jgi:Rieske Fe-S protein
MDYDNLSRREFVADTGKKILAAALLAPLAGCGVHAMGQSIPVLLNPIVLDLNKPEYRALASVGGAVELPHPAAPNKPIMVTRIDGTTVAAFSVICPHLGCKVGLPQNGVIVCPCHGSTFTMSGKVTTGPAKTDLYRFDATLNGTAVTITQKKA